MAVKTPIAALAVFVAAARAESFRTAAGQLAVTPGAVSRRIRQLETRLGTPLFERLSQGVALNAHGQALLDAIAPGIDAIDTAWAQAIERPAGGQTLSISVPPSFARHWLGPRIAAFDAVSSAVDIEASQAFVAPSWQGDRIDLAVRYGRSPWPGVAHRRLMTDRLLPVVAADHVLARDRVDPSTLDWTAYPLLEVRWPARQPALMRGDLPGWADWLVAHAGPGHNARITARHSHYDEALDAANVCNGVVLASHVLVADRLASGALVAPFGSACYIDTPFEFALITPDQGQPPPLAARFMAWLFDQAAAQRCTEA